LKQPIGKANPIISICWKISELQKSSFYKYFFKQLFITVILTFSINFLLNNNQGNFQQLCKYFPETIVAFCQKKSLDIVLSILLILVILNLVNAIIQHIAKKIPKLEIHNIINLFETINIVVDNKSKRFRAFLEEYIVDGENRKKNIFREITKPDQQIGLLINAIKTYFENQSNNTVAYKVGLVRIIDAQLHDWSAYCPEEYQPRTTIEQLSHPSSAIMQAIKSRNTILIPDIQSELSKKQKQTRKMIKGNRSADEEGSLLVDPIISPTTKNVEYVMTIAGDSKNSLIESNLEIYRWILTNFRQRIILEHNLLTIKELEVSNGTV